LGFAGVINEPVIGDLSRVRRQVVARALPMAEVVEQLRADFADDVVGLGGIAAQAGGVFV